MQSSPGKPTGSANTGQACTERGRSEGLRAKYNALENLKLYDQQLGVLVVRLEESQYGVRHGHVFNPVRYHLLYEQQLRRIIECVDGPNPLHILDVGCGDGTLMRALPPRHQVIGVDLALSRLRASGAGAGQNRSSLVVDAHWFPFRTGQFDRVVLAELIEHLPDPEQAMAEAWRVLKPGGRAVVSTPGALYHLANIGEWYTHQHLQLFSPQSLHTLVGRGGFRIRRAWYIGADLRFGIWRSQWTDRLFRALFEYTDRRFQREYYVGFGLLETRWLAGILNRLYRQGGVARRLFFVLLYLADRLSDRFPGLASQIVLEAERTNI